MDRRSQKRSHAPEQDHQDNGNAEKEEAGKLGTLDFINCGIEQYEELISFVTRLNDDATHHIGYFGVGEAEIRTSLDECLIRPSEGFFLAYENGRLIGILGVDADPEIGRAWLYGPTIEHALWHAVADQLLVVIQPLIPAGIREQELFCDRNNLNVCEFAKRHGFSPRSENAIYSLSRNEYMRNPNNPSQIVDYQDAYFEQFERLHNELFPTAYFTAKQIVERQDEHHRLLIAVEEGRLLGYHFCKIETESGYADFIGMDPSARGRGLGADLLASGLDWMFSARTTRKIDLAVNTDNEAARRMYEKFGFKSERVMCGFRRRVS